MPSKPAPQGGGTSQTTSVQLPSWVDTAAQNLWGQAQALATTPSGVVQPLPQYKVAPMTDVAKGNIQGLANQVGLTAPNFLNASDITQGVANYQPDQVVPGSLTSIDFSKYMNPYINQVLDPSLKIMDQQRQIANSQTADLAAKTGAFGGSRQGVQEGVNNAQYDLYGGQLTGQLLNQGFSTASQNATADLNRQLQAAQGNQQAGLQGANLRLGAGQQIGNLATQGQTASLQALMASLGGQQQVQQQTQAEMDAPRQDALQRLQLQQSVLGSLPYGQTQTTTNPQGGPTSNPWLTGLGALGTAASIAGTVAPLFSDRTAKTDIKKVGIDSETDLPLYSYRYKGDPKTYPKVVGVMAQDVKEKYPDQVIEVAGKLAVNPDFGPMRRSFLG